MNSKTIALTGASGYLGSHLAKTFTDAGHRVISLGRKVPSVVVHDHRAWSFSQPEPSDFGGASVLIHCAWDLAATVSKERANLNVSGSVRLFERAIALGVQSSIFVSTTSVFDKVQTVYGLTKQRVEKQMGERVLVVRPGLIYGMNSESMFGSLEKLVRVLPIVPVFGAKTRFFMSEVNDLSKAILQLAEKPKLYDPSRPVFASSQSLSFVELLKAIARRHGKNPIFIPVPWQPIFALMRVLESCGIQLPLKSDSLLSLMTLPPNQPVNPNFHFEDFK